MAPTNILPQSPDQGNNRNFTIKSALRRAVTSIRRALKRKMCNQVVSGQGAAVIDAKAIVTHWRRDPIDEWRRDQRRQEMIWRYARTATDPRADNHALAREVEGWIAGELEALGHVVRFTTHKAAYDLLIDGRLRPRSRPRGGCPTPTPAASVGVIRPISGPGRKQRTW